MVTEKGRERNRKEGNRIGRRERWEWKKEGERRKECELNPYSKLVLFFTCLKFSTWILTRTSGSLHFPSSSVSLSLLLSLSIPSFAVYFLSPFSCLQVKSKWGEPMKPVSNNIQERREGEEVESSRTRKREERKREEKFFMFIWARGMEEKCLKSFKRSKLSWLEEEKW